MSESGLPEGWATAPLADLISKDGVFSDGDWVESKDQDLQGGVRLVQLADIGDGVYRDRSRRFLTAGKAKELDCTFLETGDVLVARMPEPLGRACLFPGLRMPAVTAVDVCVIRPGPRGPSSRWLMNAINAPQFRSSFEEFEKGTTRKRISRKNLGGLPIAVPPLAEQERIAAEMEELLAEVNAARERLARVPAILKRFRQAVLGAACEGRLTEDWRGLRKVPAAPTPDGPEEALPESWSWSSGAKLFRWGSGKFLPKSRQRDGRFPIYGGNGITGHHAEHLTERPTLVIGRVGALCGNIHITPGPAWVTDNAIYASDVASGTDLRYISWVYSQADLNANAGGSGQPFVNQQALNDVRVPLPPEEEQHEIVRRVEALFKVADTIEKRVAAATVRAEKVTQAILAKAFRGELVPTEAELARREGRQYESATELLDRIRGGRAEAETNSDGRRKRAIPEGNGKKAHAQIRRGA